MTAPRLVPLTAAHWPAVQQIYKDNPNAKFVFARTLEEYHFTEEFGNKMYKKYFPGG